MVYLPVHTEMFINFRNSSSDMLRGFSSCFTFWGADFVGDAARALSPFAGAGATGAAGRVSTTVVAGTGSTAGAGA